MDKHKITCSNGVYTLTQSNSVEINCKTYYEPSKDKMWVQIPKSKENITGREFITKSMVDKEIKSIGEYVFVTKTTGPRTNLSWRSRLTKEELKQLLECEQTIQRLKDITEQRVPPTIKELQDKEKEYLKKIEELEKQIKNNK